MPRVAHVADREPAAPPPLSEKNDLEHLRLLAVFHYVVAGIGALFACFPLIHVAMGAMVVMGSGFGGGAKGAMPPAAIGYFFMALGLVFVLLGWSAAVCTFISGRYLAKRRKRLFSFVMAAILCMFAPFGTVLGIFTLIVLSKESVQRLYEKAATPKPASTLNLPNP